jgi:hypothetical protein
VESFNDWSVPSRCKHQAVEWTVAELVSLALLEAARCNGELTSWQTQHSLPAWTVQNGRKTVD